MISVEQTIDLLNWIGHVSYVFILVGMILLTKQKTVGWILRFIGESGWIVIGLVMGMSSIWFWSIIFCIVDMIGYRSWKNKQNKPANVS